MAEIIEGKTFLGTPGPGDTETAACYFGPEWAGSIMRRCVIDGRDAHWGLKLARATDLLIEDCMIRGGVERALDMVGGSKIRFVRCHFERGEYRSTTRSRWSLSKCCDIGIKGGATEVTFESCSMNDLLLGDYSVYDQVALPKTSAITLDQCAPTNAWSIISRVLHAEPVVTRETTVRRLVVPPVVVSLYFAYNRHFGDRRNLTLK